MKKIYSDENNPYADEDDGDEFEGYTVTDEEGAEISRGEDEKKKKKKENWDDGETVEASPIPKDEQVAIIDNAKISGLDAGAVLQLVIKDENSAAIYIDEKKKAGDLKPAFVKKLLETRKDLWAAVTLHSTSAPVMIKIKFYERKHKNSVKI